MRLATVFFVMMIAVPFFAQHAPSPQTLSTPLTATPATDLNTPGTLTLIKNRARVFGDRVSGSDTRYFAVTDKDLAGKTQAQVLAALSPAPVVTSQQRVREVDIVVDLKKPLVITTTSAAPVNIGSVTVLGKVDNDITIVSNVLLSGVKIVRKK